MNRSPAEVGSVPAPTLRPVVDADRELLYRIYASTRTEELAPLPWDESTKDAFLRTQFGAQDRYYRQTYPDASYDVVLARDEPVGRLYVDRGARAVLIIDVALLPPHRGRGIGTSLLTRLLDEARGVGKPVHVHVERFNPARRLYQRLGFRQAADQGIYLLLERAAQPKTAS
ncbi:MAG: GNAT family N-acetyltransferase [Solirubrobacterales bacterium]|nr:GNAT family N-acetyltransferase [Solirubrobacterales bacterium]